MKRHYILSTISISAFCCISLCAADDLSTTNHTRDQYEVRSIDRRLGTLEKADKIIGITINDTSDRKIGSVEDLAIDLQSGRIVEVIVSAGGFAGVGDRDVAIPPDQFTCDARQKVLRLDIDKERLKSAPVFKTSAWGSSVTAESISGVYSYFGATPHYMMNDKTHTPGTASARQPMEILSAKKVMGTAVHNTQNQKLGEVDNLVVDVPAGRIVEVVVSSGGFLGLGDTLSAVPPQSVRYNRERDDLTLDATKESLSSAPHFTSSQWPNLENPDYRHFDSVYRAYNVDAYFATNAPDNTAQNVRDRLGDTVTPLKQGNSPADVKTTRQIRREVVAIPGISTAGKNVKIITINGRVTLRGPVNNEDEKNNIAAIANRVAGESMVDNQLQVKGSSGESAK